MKYGSIAVLTILGLVALATMIMSPAPYGKGQGPYGQGREAHIGPTSGWGLGSRLDTLYARNVDEVYTLAMQMTPNDSNKKPVHLHKYSRVHCVCTNAIEDEWLIRSLPLLCTDKCMVTLYTPLSPYAPEIVNVWQRLVAEGVLLPALHLGATPSPSGPIGLVLHCAVHKGVTGASVSEHIARQYSSTHGQYRTSQKREDEVRKAYRHKTNFKVTTLTSFIHGKVLKAMFPRMTINHQHDRDAS